MNWFQRWLTKYLVFTKIEAIPLKPDQILVFYTKRINTKAQQLAIIEVMKPILKEIWKGDFLVMPYETIEKIDIIEKEDVKPDGTS